MYCLDPPLSRLPPGDWFCPECAHKYTYQDIERVLDYRWAVGAGLYSWEGVHS